MCLSAGLDCAPAPLLTRTTKTLTFIVLVCLSADWTGSLVPFISSSFLFAPFSPFFLVCTCCVCPQTGQVRSYSYFLTCTTKALSFFVLVCLSADWTGSPVPPFSPLFFLSHRLCPLDSFECVVCPQTGQVPSFYLFFLFFAVVFLTCGKYFSSFSASHLFSWLPSSIEFRNNIR